MWTGCPASNCRGFVDAPGSVAQGDDQTGDVVQLGEDHGASIVHVVSVEYAKNVAAAITEADGSSVFGAGCRLWTARFSRCGGFALALHGVPKEIRFLLQRILTKAKQLKNIAKVIDSRRFAKSRLESLAGYRVIPIDFFVNTTM